LIETPVYKMTYPHGNGGSTVTFDGAVFKPAGTPAAKFIDASPTGDEKCPHILTGGGIIIDNKVYSGFNGAGAELGHMVIVTDGVPCSCGRKGCWEAYSSATALIRMTKEKLDECEAQGRKTIMADMVAKKGRVTGRTSFDGMRAGDEAAKEVVDTYLHYLACGIANLLNIFQPEILSIGGGVSGEGQALLDALLPLIRKECYGGSTVKQTEIRIATLGNDAGIVGAAVLGL
jgi:glucokinase